MSVEIHEKIYSVTQRLPDTHQQRGSVSRFNPTGSVFFGALNAAEMVSPEQSVADPLRAQELAESLRLEMLNTTLTLMGDQKLDAPQSFSFSRRSLAFQSALESYRANQPAQTSSSQEPEFSQPLPDALEPLEADGRSAALSPKHQWLEPIIAKASRRYGIDAGLIKAVIKAESDFNPNAVSTAGARGLMQLMPGTAKDLGVSNSFDPEQNIMAGTRFLRNLLKRYDGDIDSTLAAYNWGPGNVDRNPDRLPRETRNYLVRVKQFYNGYAT